tara:strand:- start:133 stop:474 length:342 start_codon:yes stop_codon:yes gene_type:complete
MKAICIDSSNKPENISEYEWIEEGTIYTITEVVEMGLQDGKLGVAFEEIKLTDASAPYKYYSLERFLLIPENLSISFGEINPDDLNEWKESTLKSIPKEIDAYAEDADLTDLI